jgi:hypothetical protein
MFAKFINGVWSLRASVRVSAARATTGERRSPTINASGGNLTNGIIFTTNGRFGYLNYMWKNYTIQSLEKVESIVEATVFPFCQGRLC